MKKRRARMAGPALGIRSGGEGAGGTFYGSLNAFEETEELAGGDLGVIIADGDDVDEISICRGDEAHVANGGDAAEGE